MQAIALIYRGFQSTFTRRYIIKVVKLLFDHGADIDKQESGRLACATARGSTALMKAASLESFRNS